MKNAFYFLGVDAAAAMSRSADDGALVAGRARMRQPEMTPTSNPTDWLFEYVWAYRLRKASAREWSGLVHAKHLQFNFTRIGLDPQGGGYWVMNELNKSRQLINQVETECTPIVGFEEEGVVHGSFILTVMKRSDAGIRQLWPMLQGDDSFKDALHVVMQQAVEHAQVAFPPPFNQLPAEVTSQWSVEKQWASKALTAVALQLANIEVATKDDGAWDLTARGARRFSCKGRDDLAMAAIYAYVAFLTWLKMANGDFEDGGGGAEMFSVM